MITARSRTPGDPMAIAAMTAMIAAGAYALWISLDWGVRNDLPLLMYPAGLALRGERVPFRDIVDMNQPVSYLVYGLLDVVVGPNDRVLRALDVGLVVLLGALGSAALRVPSRVVGVTAAALFAAWHIHDAGIDVLQRELVVLVMIAGAGVALGRDRAEIAGVLAGLALFVKPHAVAFFVVLALLHAADQPRWRQGRIALRGAIGALAAGAAVLAWLAAIGALGEWWALSTGYVPLYAQQAGTMHFEATSEARWEVIYELATEPRAHPTGALLPLAVWLALRSGRVRPWRRAALGASALFVTGWLYVIPPGVFWFYHQIPAYFFGGVVIAVVLAAPREAFRAGGIELGLARFGALAVAWFLFAWPLEHIDEQANNDGRSAHARGVAVFAETLVERGETVQPLDVAQGAIDGMWRADATLAKPFLYEFMFYHHVEDPAVARLRRRFLGAMQSERAPDWIVRARPRYRMATSGPMAAGRWDELEHVIEERYEVVLEDVSFTYLRRRDR